MTTRRRDWYSRHVIATILLGSAGVLLAALVVASYVSSSRKTSGVLWRGDYESTPESWGDWKVQAEPGDAEVEGTIVRQGRFAARFAVSPHDIPIGTSGERAQVYVGQSLTRGYEGQDVWYAWSTLIAGGSILDSGSWNDLTSWHQTGPVCPAPVHVAINGTTHMLRLDAWGGALNVRACSNPYRKTWKLGKLRPGRWYDFVFHVKWSADPHVGEVEMWVNGREVVPPTHAATLYRGQGVYLKQGLYRGSANGTAVVYNDATVIARNYSGAITAFPAGSWPSVRPGVTAIRTPSFAAAIGLVGISLCLVAIKVRPRRDPEH